EGRGSKPGEVLAKSNHADSLKTFEVRACKPHDFGEGASHITAFQPVIGGVFECYVEHGCKVDIESQCPKRFGSALTNPRSDRGLVRRAQKISGGHRRKD